MHCSTVHGLHLCQLWDCTRLESFQICFISEWPLESKNEINANNHVDTIGTEEGFGRTWKIINLCRTERQRRSV